MRVGTLLPPLPQVCGMMSSPGRASSAFPLHVLVWNNDYRRLDEELQDKVTGVPSWAREGLLWGRWSQKSWCHGAGLGAPRLLIF